ncbi:MAG: apolipoprotein N-acyltransferase [Alphaproteobacteria bacterium]|nr:apolipoprotein N-acyltransferase [Alphaproteobacteria bacterium]MDE2351126.1 apolipoprotein N-acyltransferase [Alphaproteobacteria bacterium]
MAILDTLARSLANAAAFVRALSGWRRFLFAVVIGLLSALAFAPFGVFPFLLIGFAVLVLFIDGANERPHPIRNAAFAGWAFGFGHFLAGLYWVAYAFMVDPSAHEWQIPFVLALFPGGLALFPALASAVSAALWHKGFGRVFLFAIAYGCAEWLRGHILTGFPWNLPAYGWAASLAVLQSASVIGSYGLSLLTILFGASLALLGEREKNAWITPAAMSLLFAAIWAGGALRLALEPTVFVPGVQLRLVQPDVPQDEKYQPRYLLRNWNRLLELSRADHGTKPNVVIWPEAAPPFLLSRSPEALGEIAALTADKAVLMTGAVRVTFDEAARRHFYNSFYIFGHEGRIIGTYDKSHLVPFGEYLPLAGLLKRLGISKLVDSPGSFTPGGGPHTYALPGLPSVGPLICYEVIFPGAVTGRTRPGWLANVTDDSWFGPPGSTGPQQHLLTAQVRAIEEGLPIARAANTGISAVIDPFGRLVARLGSGKLGTVDAGLPAALPSTLYVHFMDMGFLVLLFACAGIVYIGIRLTYQRM